MIVTALVAGAILLSALLFGAGIGLVCDPQTPTSRALRHAATALMAVGSFTFLFVYIVVI